MGKIELRHATRKDLEAYYKNDSVYYSSRAVVAVDGDEVVGVGGVCRVGTHHLVFTDIQQDRVSKKDIIKAARMVLEIVNRYPVVIAYANEEIPTSRVFNKHFGFYPTGIRGKDGDIMMRENKAWTK